MGGNPPFVSELIKFLTSVPQPHGDWREFVCGLSAAFVNITITFPINKIIFRQIIHDVGVSRAIQQLSHEGVFFLYRGILPPLCQKSVSLSLMFGVYEECRIPMMRSNIPAYIANPSAAIIAGSIEALLTPFERVQTLLQDRSYHQHFQNMRHAFRILGAEYGFREYYRGLTPILLRNGPSNALFFYLRGEAKHRLPSSEKWWGELTKDFLSGAVIGAFLSCVFYPCNVLKFHMQSRLGVPFQSMTEAFRDIYNERNRSIFKLYRGVHMNCTRAFISWGVINVAYEWSKSVLY
ncbi:Solute carrier family 25 member 51 [Frankliniella fusca]|uniref:Solute carrier family 25 member 51 n=1 Tax=Frankliniella fusca TaxID=407009 RepID=A0AAE1L5I7_9NEOP|nr:Solute carrier family 25 member 51 [Frankliniella fusca]